MAMTIDQIANWKRLRAESIPAARHCLKESVANWEGITASGILLKGSQRIHSPYSLGVPISLSRLQRIFPELEVRSQFD